MTRVKTRDERRQRRRQRKLRRLYYPYGRLDKEWGEANPEDVPKAD